MEGHLYDRLKIDEAIVNIGLIPILNLLFKALNLMTLPAGVVKYYTIYIYYRYLTLPGSVHSFYFFAFNFIFSAFSVTLNFTIFLINVTGIGLSNGNCTAPFELLYFLISSVKAAIPEPVG